MENQPPQSQEETFIVNCPQCKQPVQFAASEIGGTVPCPWDCGKEIKLVAPTPKPTVKEATKAAGWFAVWGLWFFLGLCFLGVVFLMAVRLIYTVFFK